MKTLSQLTEKMEKLRTDMQEIRCTMEEIARKELRGVVSEFFDVHPDIAAIGWVQYTPYFNDGDPCVFTMHDVIMHTKEELDEVGEDLWNLSPWEGLGYNVWRDRNDPQKANHRVLAEAIDGFTDVAAHVWGDSVHVVLTPTDCIVMDFDHD